MDKTKINDILLIVSKAFNTGDESLLEKALVMMQEVLDTTATVSPVRADQVVAPQNNGFVSSGISWFDNFLSGGLRRQELLLLAGIPYSGKTHLLTYFASAYLLQNHRVMHFNGEDILGDILKTYCQCLTNPKQLESLHFLDVLDHDFTAQLVDKTLEAQEEKPDIVVVDHLDIMSVDKKVQDWLGISELTRRLRFIAKKYDCMVLTSTQLNYENPQYKARSPLTRLFRGKVSKVMHADIVLSIEADDDQFLYLSLDKARGRRIVKRTMKLITDFNNMEIKEA